MLQAAAVQRNATRGSGEPRQRQKDAWVGGSATVDPTPRAPEAPRVQPLRRRARRVRTTPAVMARIKADAERRDPHHRTAWVVRRDEALGLASLAPTCFKPWKRVTGVLDSMPVVGDLWRAANAWCRQGSGAGNRWVQATPTAMLRGRVGAVIGGRRQILTQRTLRQSVRETRTTVSRCLHHHRRWMTDDSGPGDGLARWDR
jgi:hypothetical protein